MIHRAVVGITCLSVMLMLAACGEDAATIAARKAAAEAQKAAAEAVAAIKKDEDSAKTAVLKSLKDPDSAKFGKISIVTIGSSSVKGTLKMACLTVNARNSYGGYAGDKQVTVANINDAWAVVGMDGAYFAMLRMKITLPRSTL